jgi:transcriptional antiterminator NusG
MAVACPLAIMEHSRSSLVPDIAEHGTPGTLRSQSAVQWYALRTRPKHEKMAASMLCGKGYESFLPVRTHAGQRTGRAKDISFPLFPGYLFCRFDVHARLPILTTPGVLYIVGSGRTPLPVPDVEVENVRRAVSSGMAPEACSYWEAGRRVYINGGPLQGVHGSLVQVKNAYRLVVSVTLLQRALSLEIDRNWAVAAAPAPARSDAAYVIASGSGHPPRDSASRPFCVPA